jgi:DNA-binding HxlR family transcriptional regulator
MIPFMLGKNYPGQDCALAAALEVLGERWTLLIIRDAFFGVRRFEDFVEHLDIPRAVLSDRLRTLVAHGVLARDRDGSAGRHYTYTLTAAGQELWPALYALMTWGSRHCHPSTRRYTHSECGIQLDMGGRCPHCDVVPKPNDIVIAVGPRKQKVRNDPVSIAMRRPHRLLEPLDTAAVREIRAMQRQ